MYAYIASAPDFAREKLVQLRRIILSVVPGAEERISYRMPSYGYKGQLAYFQLCENHIGLYVPPPVIAAHRHELKEYQTAKGTVRFPLDRKLPVALVRKMIKARMKLNDEHAAAKRSR